MQPSGDQRVGLEFSRSRDASTLGDLRPSRRSPRLHEEAPRAVGTTNCSGTPTGNAFSHVRSAARSEGGDSEADVVSQDVPSREALPTPTAVEGSLARVRPQVVLQVAAVSKRAAALGAGEGALARVQTLVHFQVVPVQGREVAELAAVPRCRVQRLDSCGRAEMHSSNSVSAGTVGAIMLAGGTAGPQYCLPGNASTTFPQNV